MKIKLSQWAKQQGISYSTAYRWFRAGKISNAQQLETGTIMVESFISKAEEKLERIKAILMEGDDDESM
jgi:predicted site-specific integrase-resolvase